MTNRDPFVHPRQHRTAFLLTLYRYLTYLLDFSVIVRKFARIFIFLIVGDVLTVSCRRRRRYTLLCTYARVYYSSVVCTQGLCIARQCTRSGVAGHGEPEDMQNLALNHCIKEAVRYLLQAMPLSCPSLLFPSLLHCLPFPSRPLCTAFPFTSLTLPPFPFPLALPFTSSLFPSHCLLFPSLPLRTASVPFPSSSSLHRIASSSLPSLPSFLLPSPSPRAAITSLLRRPSTNQSTCPAHAPNSRPSYSIITLNPTHITQARFLLQTIYFPGQ